MRRTILFSAMLGALAVAGGCGGPGSSGVSGAASGSGGAASTASATVSATGTGSGGGTGTGSSSSSGMSTGASSSVSSSSSGTGGSAQGSIVPKLETSMLYIDCQPIISKDPIHGSFTAKYTNTGAAPASAVITTAELKLGSGPNSLLWPFKVAPPDSGPVQPGATASVAHVKPLQSSDSPTGMPCNFCNGTWTLSVTWDAGGGALVTETLPASPVQCVY